MLKYLNCDYCKKRFKHGYKIDLLVHEISIHGGEILWSYDDDIEYLADFCSKKCMRDFLDEWFYFEVANGNEVISETVNPSSNKQKAMDETSGPGG